MALFYNWEVNFTLEIIQVNDLFIVLRRVPIPGTDISVSVLGSISVLVSVWTFERILVSVSVYNNQDIGIDSYRLISAW